MSLINDALKRTKDAQQQNPPPADGPPLKPVDPAAAKSASNSKSLLYIMVGCVIVGNAFLFLYLKDGEKKPAATQPGVPVTAAAASAPVSPSPAATTTPQPAKSTPAPVVAAHPTPSAAPAEAETNVTSAPPIVTAQPELPKPAPLKLQSIIYNPSRPSAMISGKFVFIGDKVQGFRVMAIDQETVTLVGSSQTNVLSLP